MVKATDRGDKKRQLGICKVVDTAPLLRNTMVLGRKRSGLTR